MQIKDLIEGAKAAAAIKDNKEWKRSAARRRSPCQEADLVAEVRKILARHSALTRPNRHLGASAGRRQPSECL